MTEPSNSHEEEIAQALRQLTADYQEGRLALPAYRRLRHKLLDSVDNGQAITPPLKDPKPVSVRPGLVVWIAAAAIIFLLVMVGWLLR